MKKFYMILGAALMMSSAMFAQHTIDEYYLSATEVNVEKGGEQGTTTISLTSPDVLANATFYMVLPEGVEVAWDDDADDWAIAGCEDLLQVKGKTKHTILGDDGAAKGFMVAVYNDKGDSPISFNKASGDLCTITFDTSSSMAEGEYEVKLIDIDLDNAAANIKSVNGWTEKVWPDVTFKIIVGTPTGIDNVTVAEDANAPVYDLNGRMINGKPAQKGIYIKNGKKVVVK